MAEVCVIVPIYKVELYLKTCVESIRTQTYKDLDIVLIDDGSPDACGVICDEYALCDKRVHVIHQKNGGLSDARNRGIERMLKQSLSTWVTFVDSDDWLSPKFIATLVQDAVTTECSIAVSGYEDVYMESGEDQLLVQKSMGSNLAGKCISVNTFWKSNNMAKRNVAWGKLYRSTMFFAIRYPSGRINEDVFTTYKVLFSTKRIVDNASKLYYYRHREGSIMALKWTPKRWDEVEALNEQIQYFKSVGNAEAYLVSLESLIWVCAGNANRLKSDKSLKGYRTDYRMELKRAVRCRCLCGSFPIGANYAVYNNLYPIVINGITWPFIRAVYFLQKGGVLELYRAVITHRQRKKRSLM